MNDHALLRDEICRVGLSLYERGHVHGAAGNISVRLEHGAGFLITPTDACLGTLDPSLLARTDADGVHAGGAPASKTLALHRAIYAAEPLAHCVIHTHSTPLVALTVAGAAWRSDCILPPITPYFVMKVGRVPLIPYHRPGDPAVAPLVAAAFEASRRRGATLRAVMLDRLGPNVWHATLAAASAALEELAETARLWMDGGRSAEPLSDARIAELEAAFGVRW
jgi:3-dehydro-4-phosphotetronate decarboxylase